MSDTSQPALEIREVHKAYGKTVALQGISFDIRRGEFFGLLGPNGAGKSTLINIIAGLVRKNSGSISVLGHDTVDDWRNARLKVGVVPQELVFDPFFNVTDMLRIQAGYYGCGQDYWPWIDHLLDKLGLADKRNAMMRTLSGGMKRRVLIAQALAHKPPLVILDEPTAGVDVELRRTLWAFMRELHAGGTTVVLTTHYLEEAQDLCSRIAIINRGTLVALETTADLMARHPFRFLSIKLANGAALPDALQPLWSGARNGHIELKVPTAEPIGAVLESLRSSGCVLEDIHTREPDLEDIFVEITGART
ncbi:MAG TPA: ABC transporter ATP-binding protein [Solimonas sp.]|nr:ABC transporter ATP-binding protein [Solimonas sp.]